MIFSLFAGLRDTRDVVGGFVSVCERRSWSSHHKAKHLANPIEKICTQHTSSHHRSRLTDCPPLRVFCVLPGPENGAPRSEAATAAAAQAGGDAQAGLTPRLVVVPHESGFSLRLLFVTKLSVVCLFSAFPLGIEYE